MKALIQRVKHAKVDVDGKTIGAIDQGLLVFIGVGKEDTEATADKMINKLLGYRVFADSDDKMNLNVQQIDGGLLLVSQFTLVANTQKGTRPSFASAAPPAHGKALYDYMISQTKAKYSKVETGEFGADMQISLLNDGPVTFMLEVD